VYLVYRAGFCTLKSNAFLCRVGVKNKRLGLDLTAAFHDHRDRLAIRMVAIRLLVVNLQANGVGAALRISLGWAILVRIARVSKIPEVGIGIAASIAQIDLPLGADAVDNELSSCWAGKTAHFYCFADGGVAIFAGVFERQTNRVIPFVIKGVFENSVVAHGVHGSIAAHFPGVFDATVFVRWAFKGVFVAVVAHSPRGARPVAFAIVFSAFYANFLVDSCVASGAMILQGVNHVIGARILEGVAEYTVI